MDDTGARPLLPQLFWGEPPVSAEHPRHADLVLPVGTVTLLLADTEGSSRLWEADPAAMTEAVRRLDALVPETIGRCGGVLPVDQGEGDSFCAAFARASDAVACALALQRADTAPICMRMGIHTGEVQLRDEGNYIGTTINRCGRLRGLAHGGQTVLSAATQVLVAERLPDGAWLADLGTHRLRDLARPEQIYQLCHPELTNEHPALNSLDAYPHNLPVQLTTFVGRDAELTAVAALLGDSRLVTLTGSGGAGKTRLGLQVTADALGQFPDGAWLVELAPLGDPGLVPSALARALGLHDEPGRTPTETVIRHLGTKRALVVLDNCEHVVDACAELAEALLRACPAVAVLATSREPLGVAGEATWRVPSLSLPGAEPAGIAGLESSEAVALFAERARLARPGFAVTEANAAAVGEICRRLDGIPLAIELAAARVKVLGPDQIAAGLQDRFRLLAGGARTAVPRQQTLRASVEWSHDLLTEPERLLLRRLAVFVGSFDIDAAEGVCSGEGLAAHQVLDQLALLVDKSLVIVEDVDVDGGTRYRLLETVRQYATERLVDAGEAEVLRRRHRDHYLAFAEVAAEGVRSPSHDRWVQALDAELDNLRVAFWWSHNGGEAEVALRLATALYGLWYDRDHGGEGMEWYDVALAAGTGVSPAIRTPALAASAIVEGMVLGANAQSRATEAVALARELGDDVLLAWGLNAVAQALVYFGELGVPFMQEGLEVARRAGADWLLPELFMRLSFAKLAVDAAASRRIAAEGLTAARALGDRRWARALEITMGMAMVQQGDLIEAHAHIQSATEGAKAVREVVFELIGRAFDGAALALLGRPGDARRSCQLSIALGDDLGMPITAFLGLGYLGIAELAAGDAAAAVEALRRACDLVGDLPGAGAQFPPFLATAELAAGEIDAARATVERALRNIGPAGRGWLLGWARLAAARLAVVDDLPDHAEDEAHLALAAQRELGDKAGIAVTLELLAAIAAAQESAQEAARLLGAAEAIRRAIGYIRLCVDDAEHEATIASVRGSLGDERFDATWAEGVALSLEEAVAYATRGRGERKRPSSGWASLTPAEHDVVALVVDGLANKQIAERLFISPRTVQTHLTHVYTKLGLSSRVQLAREAAARS